MHLTAYHLKYLAHELTLQRASKDLNKLTASLQDAQVDLNPHQIDAALFAFQSPLSKGALLADEVGLGKTIEAGILLSQHWASRQRRLLIIAPANLRKQWSQELADKFFLPSLILEAKSFNQAIKEGHKNPFAPDAPAIVICSYQFARAKEAYLKRVPWDLVTLDEAHRLRNVYKTGNRTSNAIKTALEGRKKVLLTATPLQNSILELYGLVSIIDAYVFGDLKSFKTQFSRLSDSGDFGALRERLQSICHRTLRRQVQHYINFTSRRAIVEEFEPSEPEQDLYEQVTSYLQRPHLYALPARQRQLMTLILRKLLASSTFAITGTFETLIQRLRKRLASQSVTDDLRAQLGDVEGYEEEWEEAETADDFPEILSEAQIEAIKAELAELEGFHRLAGSITRNTKAERLFTALGKGFEKLAELGAARKAIIFTESRRTQEFLLNMLNTPGVGYPGKVMLFNGSNTDAESARIYRDWLKRHKGTDRITGSPTADKRAALVDYFREEATIMIATEAAAEGINLQFCSLVVNYDLPWNPQRIEQRIGRCHRYGQKHDVVVVNFLNVANAADQRVYELLDEKFRLFDGVFGASDEVLGAIGSGIDFEMRIARIYQECRTPETIRQAFDALQDELRADIKTGMEDARRKLLENMDEEVREKLRVDFEATKGYLNQFQQRFWMLTRTFLQPYATFSDDCYGFELHQNPFPQNPAVHSGKYRLLAPKEGEKKSNLDLPDDTSVYRIGHPLARHILEAAQNNPTPVREITFNYTQTPTAISLLKPLVGSSGWLAVVRLSIAAFEQEECLLLVGLKDSGEPLDSDLIARFFSLDGTEGAETVLPETAQAALQQQTAALLQQRLTEAALRDQQFFDAEMDKLDRWAEDMKVGLSREIDDLDAEIKLRKAEARTLPVLEAKVAAQRAIKELEKTRAEKRKRLFLAQDEIDEQKDALLTSVEEKLGQSVQEEALFTIRWTIV